MNSFGKAVVETVRGSLAVVHPPRLAQGSYIILDRKTEAWLHSLTGSVTPVDPSRLPQRIGSQT